MSTSGPCAGGRAQQRRDRVEELKAGGVGLAGVGARRRRRRRAGCSARARGSGTSRVSRAVASGPSAASASPMSRSAASRRRIRSHGQYAGAPPPSQARPHRTVAPARDGLGADRVGERRLADARVAGDHEQPRRGRRARPPGPGAARRAHARARRGSPCRTPPAGVYARRRGSVRRGRRSRPACAPTAYGACSSRARTSLRVSNCRIQRPRSASKGNRWRSRVSADRAADAASRCRAAPCARPCRSGRT